MYIKYIFIYIYGVFCFMLWCQMCRGEVEYVKRIYNTISPHTFHEAVRSLLGAWLKEGTPLHQRPMCFVIKEHQVSPWTLSLGGQNFNYITELWKTQHWPSDQTWSCSIYWGVWGQHRGQGAFRPLEAQLKSFRPRCPPGSPQRAAISVPGNSCKVQCSARLVWSYILTVIFMYILYIQLSFQFDHKFFKGRWHRSFISFYNPQCLTRCLHIKVLHSYVASLATVMSDSLRIWTNSIDML